MRFMIVIPLTVFLFLANATSVAGDDFVTLQPELGEQPASAGGEAPGSASIPIPVQIVPGSGLSLPDDIIPVESDGSANDVGLDKKTNPLINEEIIEEGSPNGGTLIEEQVISETEVRDKKPVASFRDAGEGIPAKFANEEGVGQVVNITDTAAKYDSKYAQSLYVTLVVILCMGIIFVVGIIVSRIALTRRLLVAVPPPASVVVTNAAAAGVPLDAY